MKYRFYFFLFTISYLSIFLLSNLKAKENYTNLLFIHHSVGERLIKDGNVRLLLKQSGYRLWDQGFTHSERGLHDPDGKPVGTYDIPENNTSPFGYAKLFDTYSQEGSPFRKIISNHNVIIFKSCFPVSKIAENNKQLDLLKPYRRSIDNYKNSYLSIRRVIDLYPDKIFIIVTQPPLHPLATSIAEASRARVFVEWLKSDAYLGNRSNLFVFDFFSLLSNADNMLTSEYRLYQNHPNSHPNSMAYMQIGPKFVDFMINAINQKYTGPATDHFSFPYLSWPDEFVNMDSPKLRVNGSYSSVVPITKITWSDIGMQKGVITSPSVNFTIDEFVIRPGVTQLHFTAIDSTGRRSSSVIGFSYYPFDPEDMDILDITSQNAYLEGASFINLDNVHGLRQLIIQPKGDTTRAVVRNASIDVSRFDPKSSHFLIEANNGANRSEIQFIFKGLGTYYYKPDVSNNYLKIIIPLSNFKFLTNTFDELIIKSSFDSGDPLIIEGFYLIHEK